MIILSYPLSVSAARWRIRCALVNPSESRRLCHRQGWAEDQGDTRCEYLISNHLIFIYRYISLETWEMWEPVPNVSLCVLPCVSPDVMHTIAFDTHTHALIHTHGLIIGSWPCFFHCFNNHVNWQLYRRLLLQPCLGYFNIFITKCVMPSKRRVRPHENLNYRNAEK